MTYFSLYRNNRNYSNVGNAKSPVGPLRSLWDRLLTVVYKSPQMDRKMDSQLDTQVVDFITMSNKSNWSNRESI